MARNDDWTAARKGRGRRSLKVVQTRSIPRLVESVAFDQFVFDERALTRQDGGAVVRGTDATGTVLAVGSMPWPDMPVEWTALQSRRAQDLLGLEGDEMEPVGHNVFDDAFSVDADDVSTFRRLFRTSLREWLVRFDEEHGPLIVLFDGPDAVEEPPAEETPRRRKTDRATGEMSGETGDERSHTADSPRVSEPPRPVPTLFVARPVDDDAAAVATLDLTVELAEHVRDAVHA